MLLNLPEIEACPDLHLRVMEQVTEQVPQQLQEPEPRSGFVSCAEIRLQIDRQPKVTAPSSDNMLEKISAHTQSCVHCAEYLDSAEQVEQMLLSLPEIEPCPDLCLRVMEQLNEQVPEQDPEPEPRPGLVPTLLQQLLKNLGILLACAGLVAANRADLLGNRLSELVPALHIFPKLPALVPAEQTVVYFAIACLLLLLSIKGRPGQDRNTTKPSTQRAG
jgi:hypothetical protein